jgi:sugar/nucleoside kinase (ribokinase family)
LRDADYDVVLVSDQAETEQGGVVTAPVRAAVEALATRRPETVVWVDSRMRAELFRGVVVKPNHHEAEAAAKRLLGSTDYEEWRRRAELRALIVTHGGDGAMVVEAGGTRRAASRRVENPVDICGAGDSFSAAGSMALRVTGDAVQAAEFGNRVAGITIMKRGTGTASPAEVLAAGGDC